ncbi:MAG: Uma2 family endonuclease [Saprospiraceae bacterium]|nr:Uma2 family endonuclease [Saprospiraceae bacterium]
MESAIASSSPVSKKKIPAYLIKEEFDGIPLYYKGYREVLSGKKTLEDIMPSSSIHSVVLFYLVMLIGKKLDEEKYWLLGAEVGLKTTSKIKAGLDIAIFEKSVLTPDLITRHFANVPPKVVIEVDVDIESDIMTPMELIQYRTKNLHGSGVEKIIWIFTLSKMILVAENGKDWSMFDWDREVEVIDGITFNVAQYLKNKGIVNF